MKTILKVLYIAIMVVMTVVVYMGMYNSYAADNYAKIVTDYIQEGKETNDYSKLPAAFSIFKIPYDPNTLFDSKTSYSDNDVRTLLFASINQTSTSYTTDGEKQKYLQIEDVYLLYILNPDGFQHLPSNNENTTAIRFYFQDSTKRPYDYLLDINSDENKNLLATNPTTLSDAILGAERSLITQYDSGSANFDMIFVPLTQTLIQIIETNNQSKITGFNIVDNKGDTVYSSTINFQFGFNETSFFTDTAEFTKYLNIKTRASESVETYDDDTLAKANDYIESFGNDPDAEIPNFSTKYKLGIERGDIYTGGDMIFKSLGICVLFAVAAALIFFIIFYFKKIKKFVRRLAKKEQPVKRVPARSQSKPVISKPVAKPIEKEAPVAEVVEEPAAEVVEEPAAEVVEEPVAEVVEEPAVEVVEEPAAEVVEETKE